VRLGAVVAAQVWAFNRSTEIVPSRDRRVRVKQ
jgi:hypothetical protein